MSGCCLGRCLRRPVVAAVAPLAFNALAPATHSATGTGHQHRSAGPEGPLQCRPEAGTGRHCRVHSYFRALSLVPAVYLPCALVDFLLVCCQSDPRRCLSAPRAPRGGSAIRAHLVAPRSRAEKHAPLHPESALHLQRIQDFAMPPRREQPTVAHEAIVSL